MKCKCGEEMKFIWCYDDDQGTDIWFNVYVCENCGMIWKDRLWIDGENKVTTG